MNIATPFAGQRTLPPSIRARGVTAVLGPTNTGKTHLAIERMLGHSSGLIGLPLRLLAREVYGKLVARAGEGQVALITGEERIKPANPRYWVATVEAMPRDLDVAFVALDEIQIAADLDRGHIFTDRMLNRRGREETLLLGAATMRPLVEKLIPGASILVRPRLSNLVFAGEKKLTRLPRRSAIVAFSADEVYAIAELVRRQRGGAAVVLGALSPRTRNAQVELYQNGDVDYLVATDAIGMGLNLDVDHVAFAGNVKFDGWQFRRLNPGELAQIAGRAGRAQRDGTFGTTGRCEPFDAELVERLESHAFEPHRVLQWRNTELDFRSINALQSTLALPPKEDGLTRAPTADDIRVLDAAVRHDEVRRHANSAAAIERLWETCQLPDYRKVSPASHTELVMRVYDDLMRLGKLDTDWFARQVALADRAEGDIDTLSGRIAQVRTWTFAANRPDWLEDPEHWRGVTRGVEDRLSDALHERLAHRFVDRRTSVLMRRLRENVMLDTEITKTGDVVVEGHVIGHLLGFQFAADPSAGGPEAKALRATAQKALAGEIEARAGKLAGSGDDAFVLSMDGTLRWIGDPVAKLIPGEELLEPRLKIISDEHLTGPSRDGVQARLDLWLKAHIEKLLGPLLVLGKAEDVTGIARGIAFQLVESLGVLERHRVAEEMKALPQDARAVLRGHGVRFGAHHIYLPALLKPAPRTLAAQLWGLKHGGLQQKGLDELPHLASSGRTSIPVDNEIQKGLYRAVGFRVAGARAVRIDILERLADLIRPALAWRPGAPGEKPAGALDGSGFVATVAMTSLAGCAGEDFASILRALGYRMERRPAPPVAAPVEAAPIVETQDVVEGAPTEIQHVSDAPLADAEAAPTEQAEAVGTPETTPLEDATGDLSTAPAEADAGEASLAAPTEAEPGVESTQIDTTEAESTVSAQDAAPGLAHASEAPLSEEPADTAATLSGEASEPAMIEVWRPGRPPGQQRPPHQGRGRPHGQNRGQRSDNRGSGEAAPGGEATSGERQDQRPPRNDRRPDRRSGEHPAAGASESGARDKRGQENRRDENRREFRRDGDSGGNRPRPDREGRERRTEEGRGERARGSERGAHRADRGGQENRHENRHDARGDNRRERTQQIDPNSPFAALLALKARMEADKGGN